MCIMFITDKTKGLPRYGRRSTIFLQVIHTVEGLRMYIRMIKVRDSLMEKGIMDKETFVSKVAEHYKKLNADSDYMIVHTRNHDKWDKS